MKTFKTKEEAQAALNARARANVQTTVDTRGYSAPVSDADAEFASALQRGDASQAAKLLPRVRNPGGTVTLQKSGSVSLVQLAVRAYKYQTREHKLFRVITGLLDAGASPAPVSGPGPLEEALTLGHVPLTRALVEGALGILKMSKTASFIEDPRLMFTAI